MNLIYHRGIHSARESGKTSAEKLYKNRAVEIGYFSQLYFLCNITFAKNYLCTELFLCSTIFMDISKVNPVRTALLR